MSKVVGLSSKHASYQIFIIFLIFNFWIKAINIDNVPRHNFKSLKINQNNQKKKNSNNIEIRLNRTNEQNIRQKAHFKK